MTHQAKAPSAGSTQATGKSRGLFRRALATRAASSGSKGSGAPAARLLALLGLALLALFASAAPASAAPPTFTTPVVSEISYTSAKVTAEVTNDGSEGFAVYEFQYSSDDGATWSPSQGGVVAASPSPQTLEADLHGLKGPTHYNVRLSVNTHCVLGCGGPLYYSPEAEFTTLPVASPAILGPVAASEVKYTTAKASGEIERPANPDPAFDANCRFEYVTDAKFDATGYAEAAPPVPCGIDSLTAPNAKKHVEVLLSDLAPATEYHLRLTASNAGPDASLEAASTFTTLAVDPPSVVSIENAGEVEYTQAQVKGVVKRPNTSTDPAFDVECNFEYISDELFEANPSGEEFAGATPVACNPNPVTAADTAPGATKEVKATLPGLAPSTTYHLRLAVSNKGGSDSKEAAATFTSAGPIPKPVVLATDDASAVSYRSATVSGEVERPAGADPALNTSCRFEYVADDQFKANPVGEEFTGAGQAGCETEPPENPITATGQTPVTADLTGLESGATYHLRLAAENAGGTATKDAPSTFTTLPGGEPTFSIDPNPVVGYTTLKVFGTANHGLGAEAEAEVLQYIFEVAEAGTENWSGCCEKHSPPLGAGPQNFSYEFTGLKPGTEYKYRLVLIRDSGGGSNPYTYSPEPYPTVTTRPLEAPTATLDPVTIFTGTTAHFTGTVDTHAPAGPLDDLGKAAYKTDWRIECTPACPGPGGEPYSGTVQGEEGSKAISIDVRGLEADTHYEVKLVAHNDFYSVETPPQTFDTLQIPPTVKSTPGASDGKGGYTLQGIVNPNNQTITGCEFKWGPDAAAYAFSAGCSPMPKGFDEVQKITIQAIAGQFRLSYRGQTTGDIDLGAPASLVEAELQALSAVGTDNVNVSDVGGYTVTFTGALSETNAPLIGVENGTVALSNGAFEPDWQVTTISPGGNSLSQVVEAHLTGLNTGVNYHALLVVTYGAGAKAQGVDQEFTVTLDPPESCSNAQLRRENNSLALPECRAYEMVTPPGKEGFIASVFIPALSGFSGADAISYGSEAGNLAKSGKNSVIKNAYVAARSEAGWETIPNLNGASGSIYDAPSFVDSGSGQTLLRAYSSDLRSSIWTMHRKGDPIRRNPDGTEIANLYLRNPDGTFTLLAIPSINDPGVNVSDDLSHVVLGPDVERPLPYGPGIYEFVGTGHPDQPRRVDLDNTGSPISTCGVGGVQGAAIGQAVSSDGRVIIFAVGGGCGGANPPANEIWARVNGTTSFDVSASQCNRGGADPCNAPIAPEFVGATPDGSRVFFTTKQQLVNGDTDETKDLYACDIPSGNPAPAAGKANPCSAFSQISVAETDAAEVENVLTTSADGSTVLFTAKGVLADNEDGFEEKAVAGDGNLYVWHQDSAHPAGQTSFVGKVVLNDVNIGGAQATPDGHYVVFTSAIPLVETDTDSSRDVYRVDAETGELARVSTNILGVGGNGNFDAQISNAAQRNPTAAISDDGQKIVFTTKEALSPLDGNAESDVYLWTPARVSLISTGSSGYLLVQSGQVVPPGVFINGSGQDIYFESAQPLTPADGDDLGDVYDARIGGGFSFAQPARCSGAGGACQSHSPTPAPTPAPESAKPGSEGNVVPRPCPKGKVRNKKGKCVKKSSKKHSGKKHHGKKHDRTASHGRGGNK